MFNEKHCSPINELGLEKNISWAIRFSVLMNIYYIN